MVLPLPRAVRLGAVSCLRASPPTPVRRSHTRARACAVNRPPPGGLSFQPGFIVAWAGPSTVRRASSGFASLRHLS